jgi:hypothetical protein
MLADDMNALTTRRPLQDCACDGGGRRAAVGVGGGERGAGGGAKCAGRRQAGAGARDTDNGPLQGHAAEPHQRGQHPVRARVRAHVYAAAGAVRSLHRRGRVQIRH